MNHAPRAILTRLAVNSLLRASANRCRGFDPINPPIAQGYYIARSDEDVRDAAYLMQVLARVWA